MGAAATNIPIRHSQVVHAVETTRARKPQELTLLELVEAVGDITRDEAEIVATVVHMLSHGMVKLCGNFRREPIEKLIESLGEPTSA